MSKHSLILRYMKPQEGRVLNLEYFHGDEDYGVVKAYPSTPLPKKKKVKKLPLPQASVSQLRKSFQNLGNYFFNYVLFVFRCCPRSQNYGCRSYRRRLPCHSHYVNGVREWCCPFSLGNFFRPIYIFNCNCR